MREKWSDDQWDFRYRLAKTPDVLFSTCRVAMEEKYPGSPLAVPSGKEGVSAPTAHLPLDVLEQRVAETCAKDLVRMQRLRTMYTSYRQFRLIHGTAGRDTPLNVRLNEVRSRLVSSYYSRC